MSKTCMLIAGVLLMSLASGADASILDGMSFQGFELPKPQMVIPEPGTAAVCGIGLASLLLRRRA
ncbi:MAG: hypothetical protein RLN76_09125 [Phycisphaeraceae bacterium]